MNCAVAADGEIEQQELLIFSIDALTISVMQK
jgi:hypothetical protein